MRGGYAATRAAIRNLERYRCAASLAGVTDFKKQSRYDADFFSPKGARKWRNRVRGEDKGCDLDTVAPAQNAGRLTRPLLLAHGTKDTVVPFRQRRVHGAAGEMHRCLMNRGAFRQASMHPTCFLALYPPSIAASVHPL